MSKEEPVYTEVMEWEGFEYVSGIIDSTDFSGLDPVTQVQAVCFHDGEVVNYNEKNEYENKN